MQVLLISPFPPPYGGIANWTLLIQKNISGLKDVEIAGTVNIAPQVGVLEGRTLWNRVVGQGLEMLKQNKQLKKEIEEKKPDVIHLTTSGSLAIIRDLLFIKTARSAHIPLVYHIHFGRITEISDRNTMEWRMLKKAIALSTKTIAIDEKTYCSLKHYFSDQKIFKVANPFDLSSVKVVEKVNKSKILMFLGWCIKSKGVEELLAAWEKIHDRYPEWVLHLVGPVEASYKQMLECSFNMEQVVMEGEKTHREALQLLNEANVFILPSYTEGFPNAVLEAMALEKPIIASNVGAISEMLDNDAGIVIPPCDSESIVEALDYLLANQNLQLEYGKNARKRLINNYTVEIIMEKYKKIWDEAVKDNEHI